MLHQFIRENRDELIRRIHAKAQGRLAPRPSEAEMKHGVPMFLDQLVHALQSIGSGATIGESAALNGSDLLKMGITIAQVVHVYGDICQAVTQLAIELAAPITTPDWQIFNRCQDEAIAEAVTEFARQREGTIAAGGTERLGILAHELRNRLNVAMLSFEMIKNGSVGVGGSTGAMLGSSLRGIRDLVDRSLAEVRLEAKIEKPERISLAEFIEELEVAATLDAEARGIGLSVARVDYGLAVFADRQLLASAVFNLLQNAFKFTRPRSSVSLRISTDESLVLIEVEDECGGLPQGKAESLFQSFTQSSEDRTGLGLGLSISRQSVESSGGKISVRNIPGKGCVFRIALPKVP